MTASLGSAALALAFLTAVFAAVLALTGRGDERRRLVVSGARSTRSSACSPSAW